MCQSREDVFYCELADHGEQGKQSSQELQVNFYLKLYLVILAVLGLCSWARAFSSCREQGYSADSKSSGQDSVAVPSL